MSVLLITCGAFSVKAEDVNVLIIGSEKDIGDASSSYGSSVAFKGAGIKTELQKILNGAGLGTVKVEYEDMSSLDPTNSHNLISWFFADPNLQDIQRTQRWPNLRGEKGTDWDYVVLIGDPFTMEYVPGMYAHGVAKVAAEVSKGGAETILLMPWPGAGSERSINHYKEVVYRVGRSGGHKVAPAGLAWQAANLSAGGGHPNANGAYVAAASIYSRVWGKSASTSTYNYNDTLADSVHTTVTQNIGKVQYSGLFNFNYNLTPFRERVPISTRMTINSSTERGMMDGILNAISATGNGATNDKDGTPYYLGRNTGLQEDNTWFPIPISKVRDVRVLFGSVRSETTRARTYSPLRYAPATTILASLWQESGLDTLETTSDGVHLNIMTNSSTGAYWYTLISGRTPMYEENPQTLTGMGLKAGYELAWHVTHCQSRAPGFQARPSSSTIGKLNPEVINVRFLYKPRADVTVTTTSTIPGIVISPSTLTFTPENYNQSQAVNLLADANMVPGTPLKINLTTSSNDEVYNQLLESWNYVINTPPVVNPQTVDAYSGDKTPITLTGSDADGETFTFHIDRVITRPPAHGTAELLGGTVVYKSYNGYIGPDSFSFVANDGSDDSLPAEVSINVLPKTLFGFNLLKNGSAELLPFSDFGWFSAIGTWEQKSNVRDGLFAFGKIKSTLPSDLYQDVNVRNLSQRIDHGVQYFRFSGLVCNGLTDQSSIGLAFMDDAQRVLKSVDSGVIGSNFAGLYYSKDVLAPVGTRTVRFILNTNSDAGQFDALSLVALKLSNIAPEAQDQTGLVATSEIPNSISLKATDLDDDLLEYQIISGPSHGTLSVVDHGPEVIYQTNGAYTGSDQFTFRVYDGTTFSNVATVSLNVVHNQAPVIVLDSPILAPDGSAAITANLGILLETTVHDDGKPGPLTLTWEDITGGGSTITNPNSDDTGVYADSGVHTYRLTASDGELTTTQDVTVKFSYYDESYAFNIGPYNQSGTSYSGLVGKPVTLDNASTVDFDELPNGGDVTVEWRLVSGPGELVFADPTKMDTAVTAYAVGQYSLRFVTDDGGIKTYTDATLVITADPNNAQPTASDLSLSVDQYSVDNPITLLGADAESASGTLAYSVVDQPAHGTLGGTAPNLTYTPAEGYFGEDSFTYRVKDNSASSALATVSITVTKVSLDVDAGADQTVVLAADPVRVAPVAGALMAFDASQDTPGDGQWSNQLGSTYWIFDGGARSPKLASDDRFSALTHYYEFPAARSAFSGRMDNLTNNVSSTLELVVDIDGANGSILDTATGILGLQIDIVDGVLRASIEDDPIEHRVVHTLSSNDMRRFIHVVVIVDKANKKLKLYVDGKLRDALDYPGGNWATSSTILGGNNGGVDLGSNEDFVGKMAIFRVYNKVFTDAEVATNFRALSGLSATVSLDGTISDGVPVQQGWSVKEGPGGANFGNSSATDTTATFAVPGRYTLELSAEDGVNPTISDTMFVNVLHPTGDVLPPGPFELTVVNGEGSGFYEAGATVQLAATIPQGDNFVQWTGDTAGVANTSAAITTMIMPDSDVHLTATFQFTAANVSPNVNAGSARTVPFVANTGGTAPVGNAYFVWDAAQDSAGNNSWSSATSNAYSWGFGSSLTASVVNDPKLKALTKAYDFPAAKSGTQTTFWGPATETASATWEFVLDVDSDYGLIMETGDISGGIQLWLENGVLRGDIRRNLSGYRSDSTVSHSLSFEDRAGFIHVVFVIDMQADQIRLYVNNALVDSAFWDGDLWTNKNAAGLGTYGGTTPAETTHDFSGRMALIRYYDSKALSAQEVSTNFVSLLGVTPTLVTMQGSANDPDGGPLPLTTRWSVASTSPAGLSVWFEDISAVNTTAIFRAPGVYNLRLSADDGESVVSKVVTITISSASFADWITGYDLGGLTGMTDDPDGDRMNNMLEYAFGTNPSQKNVSSLTIDGTRHGSPIAATDEPGKFYYYFMRRVDHGQSGSLKYTASFSDDLATFENHTSEPQVVGASEVDPQYEVVRVQFPSSLVGSGNPARFARLLVEPAP